MATSQVPSSLSLLKRSLSEQYDPQEVEPRWQAAWRRANIFTAPPSQNQQGERDDRPKYYILEMFPYPSGRLHMGHMRNYCLGDVLARAHRMAGKRVLYPLGWDAFGLPAENAALSAGVHPQTWTEKNIEAMKGPMLRMGLSYDETREIRTCDPEYFVHEQRLFIEMFKKGLAYRKKARVNFCPTCETVLANEQVEDGLCWRCQSVVVSRDLEQWFLRITSYAERLLEDLSLLEKTWPEKVINMQRKWIGRSEGAMIQFPLEKPLPAQSSVDVFTTRPDTLYGVTFLSLAPEHPLSLSLSSDPVIQKQIQDFVKKASAQDRIERMSDHTPKEGLFTGAYAIHPVTKERLPIYLANFVLMEYGTGAVMAVPAHDQRDFDFAKQQNLPIRVVISSTSETLSEVLDEAQMTQAYSGDGVLVHSGPFTGMDSHQAKWQMTTFAEQQGFGKKETQYRLRDWLVSRQRYWGCPIPMVRCVDGGHGYQPVPEADLPVLLPFDVDFKKGGSSPLARHPSFQHTVCPVCKGPALRETDTMDGFMESSWYFLRYPDPRCAEKIVGDDAMSFLPIDQYIGGAEHATKHLIYARFFTKMLSDWNVLPSSMQEPFLSLLSQGMVLKDAYRCETHDYLYPEQVSKDGHCLLCGKMAQRLRQMKMSKSFRNVIEPMPLIEKYGADTARVFALFAAPPDSVMEWSDASIEGAYRFLQRVYRLVQKVLLLKQQSADSLSKNLHEPHERDLRRKTHQTLRRVTHDVFDRKQYNTAIAAMMELTNDLTSYVQSGSPDSFAMQESVEILICMLNPMAPHLCEELWQALGHHSMLAMQPWPAWNESLAKEDELTIIVQVNGKKRGEVRVLAEATEQEVMKEALSVPNVAEHLLGLEIKKTVYVKGRLLSLVV